MNRRKSRCFCNVWRKSTRSLPVSYLAKILQVLTRANLIHSQRGAKGGFVLGVPAQQLTLLDVVRVVDTSYRIAKCPMELPLHVARLCPLHRRLDEAAASVETTISTSGEPCTQP